MSEGLAPADLQIRALGPCVVDSPLRLSREGGEGPCEFVAPSARVLFSVEEDAGRAETALSFEKAGPRHKVYFEPGRVRAGIVTCGGLCPGINSVVRSLILELHHGYGVHQILGFRFGYEGLVPDRGMSPVSLTPAGVQGIHRLGGSVLGQGRGPQDPAQIVAHLEALGVDVLFTVGGDGTLRGAHAISEAARRRGVLLGVVGIPKTIDNDVAFVDQTFGFETAVQVAAQALEAAHTEATSVRNGIGVVKLMGREAGFISAHAALASLDVNFCLIPEVPFDLSGKGGLFEALRARLLARGHALIVVAEGCRLPFDERQGARDPSGNLRYGSGGRDVGPRLCEAIRAHFVAERFPIEVKYIDPGYMIRSVAANASDNRNCDLFARNAVHAAMAGKTDLVVGRWHGSFTHVPLALSTTRRKRVDAHGDLWIAVTSMTGQPPLRRQIDAEERRFGGELAP